jgi:hypothetical protein
MLEVKRRWMIIGFLPLVDLGKCRRVASAQLLLTITQPVARQHSFVNEHQQRPRPGYDEGLGRQVQWFSATGEAVAVIVAAISVISKWEANRSLDCSVTIVD